MMDQIRHEDIISIANFIKMENYIANIDRAITLAKYVRQQEKKDEISQVKDEIISLYRQYVFSDKLSERIFIREKITALEVKHNLRKMECE